MKVLIGEPVKGSEARALRRLYDSIEGLDGLLLVNFYLGERQFDFIVVLPNHTWLIELKSLAGPTFGGQNGNWSVCDFTGEVKEYRGLNPWAQAVALANVLSDEMARFSKTRQDVPSPLNGQFYREFETVASIYPILHPNSKITVTSWKAKVIGFDDLILNVNAPGRKRSWSLADWEHFATQSLSLKIVSLRAAVDQRVHDAHNEVTAYLRSFSDFYNYDLAPLPATRTEPMRGRELLQRLQEPRHTLLIGPSGSCKSFHLKHLAVLLASEWNEVPILVDPRGYGGGDLSRLLQQSTSPFSATDVGKLIGSVVVCGQRPVLIIDALNECPDASCPKLLEKLQAFVRLRDARLLMADHLKRDLPPDLNAVTIEIERPVGDERSQIFSYYAGQPLSDALAHLSRDFTNAFDLKLAGKCHARGNNPRSRWDLYSRYVRDTLQGSYIVASALLRSIAGEMMESLTMAIRRDRFEKLAESFYEQHQAPRSAIDQLLQSRVIAVSDDYISFEHELLLDFFKVQYLDRNAESSEQMVSSLRRPRNVHLLELAVAQIETKEDIQKLLATASDPEPLTLALQGRCGQVAATAIREQCLALIALGMDETTSIVLTCQTFEGNDGRRGLVGFEIVGNRPLSAYGSNLCDVIAENLDDTDIQREFLKLLDRTEATFFVSVRKAAHEAGVSVLQASSESLRSYGGILSQSSETSFVCSSILSAIRNSRMTSRRSLHALPILSHLLRNVRTDGERYFSFFTLVIDLQRDSSGLPFDEVLELVQKAWTSRVGWLRMEAVRVLTFLHRRASTLGEQQVSDIRELLQSFETKDVLLNTEILEALAGYDGFEPPVAVKDAIAEMRELIGATDEPTQEQLEGAALFEITWPEYRRTAAHTVLGKIFEDIFMGAYYEAYQALSDIERKAILELAATSVGSSLHIDWIMWELLPLADAATLHVFHRFAVDIDGDTPMPQDVISAFLTSVRGYARLSKTPPELPIGAANDRKAWALVASVLFWSFKDAGSVNYAQYVVDGWKVLREELPSCVPDIYQKINESQWLNKEHSINLSEMFPEEMRPIMEKAIKNRRSLTSLFRHGGSNDERVIKAVISTLGAIGNQNSIEVLEELIEDSKIGRSAVDAIHAIGRRS
jgi:hypothetical protein